MREMNAKLDKLEVAILEALRDGALTRRECEEYVRQSHARLALHLIGTAILLMLNDGRLKLSVNGRLSTTTRAIPT